MHSQDGTGSPTNFDFQSPTAGGRRANSKARPVKASMDLSVAAAAANEGPATEKRPAQKGTRFQAKDKQVQMSPKVLETWINETL